MSIHRRQMITLRVTDSDLDKDFERFESDFYKYEEFDVESTVRMELEQCWEDLALFAREEYEKFGKGFICIEANCLTEELDYNESLVNKTAVYIPKDLDDVGSPEFFNEYMLSEYDPETEVVLAIEFIDGRFEVIAGFGEVQTIYQPNEEITENQRIDPALSGKAPDIKTK